jgi:hypothetical protein
MLLGVFDSRGEIWQLAPMKSDIFTMYFDQKQKILAVNLTGSFSSLEYEKIFDRLPRTSRSEILTSDGRVERVVAKQVETIYRSMKQYSENKCRELQVYKPL